MTIVDRDVEPQPNKLTDILKMCMKKFINRKIIFDEYTAF